MTEPSRLAHWLARHDRAFSAVSLMLAAAMIVLGVMASRSGELVGPPLLLLVALGVSNVLAFVSATCRRSVEAHDAGRP